MFKYVSIMFKGVQTMFKHVTTSWEKFYELAFGGCRPRTPARGVLARGGMRPWGTVGPFSLIFQFFEKKQKLKKHICVNFEKLYKT